MTGQNIEQTCTLVKPDGVRKGAIGAILGRFEQAGLQLVGLKFLQLTQQDAERFYAEHQGKPFYPGLIEFMTSGPIVAAVWRGEGAIQRARGLMGATNSKDALPGTIRHDFGTDNRYNVVHGSDSPVSAEREIQFFFEPRELLEYPTGSLKGNNDGESKKTSHRLTTR